jgi:DNA polymerase-3 subunit delta
MPFASSIRLVSIQDVDKTAKSVIEELIDYMASPTETTVLILTATKLKADSRLVKAVKQLNPKAVINCESKKRSELPSMVQQMAKSYQIIIGHEATQKLIELTGESTVAINTELQKLANYLHSLGKSEASKNEVMAVVAKAAQPSPWDFVEAVSQRDLILAMELLLAMPNESPISLLALCIIRIRELLMLKSVTDRGTGNLAKAMKKPDWQIRKLQSSAAKFEATELRQFLSLAASVDMQMKSGKDAQQQLNQFLLSVCDQ